MDTSIRWTALVIRLGLSLVVVALYCWFCTWLQPDQMRSIATTMAGIAGTLLGFLLMAMSLLTAVMDRNLVLTMKKTGHYQRLIMETFHACAVLLATLVCGIICLFLANTELKWSFCILVFLSTLSLLYVIESGRRFKNIFLVMS